MIGKTSLIHAALAVTLALPSLAAAQSWPSRPITMVVPFPAGGANDIPARALANDISPKLGAQVVIDNRSGANGNIGAAVVAKAEPDGYTLLFSAPGVLATNRFLYKNVPFDPDRAFAPIILVAKSPLIIVTNPKLPTRNLGELIAFAKANPGKINAGIPSVGSQAHMTLELMAKKAGITFTYVPYRGGVNVNADLLGGQIDIGINFTPGLVELVANGSLRGLATTGATRSLQFPAVPTLQEQGFRDFESVAWYSVVAPAGTPSEIIGTLNSAINSYLKSETGRRDLTPLDMAPVGGTPEDLRDYIASEVAKWGPIIKAANIRM